jgi:hypothetical protein
MAWVQSRGTRPIDIRDVNKSDKGPAWTGASFLKRIGGKPSGPLDLVFFIFLMAAEILRGEKSILSMHSLPGKVRAMVGVVPLSSAHTEPK